jgi:hypothetical protein
MPQVPFKPTPSSSFWFDDSKLYVSKECWHDLIGDQSVVGLAGVVAHAREVIRRSGAFVIDAGQAGVQQRVDRMSEFEQLVADVVKYRADEGLQAL